MTAELRPLGRTGLSISRLGFGTWAAGGSKVIRGWGDQDDERSMAAMRAAVEAGVTWIDTAAVYGIGHAETLCGRLVADFSEDDRPLVFTKCGRVPVQTGDTVTIGSDLSAGGLIRQVDESLRRLGLPALDLLFVHWPPADGGPSLEVYWETMDGLRRAGKVRAIGLSNHDVELVGRAHAQHRVDAVQPPFSAIQRGAAAELLPWCAANDVAVVAYSPMQSGLLTGAFTEERAAGLPSNDWRSSHPDFTAPALQRNLEVAGAMSVVARRHDVPASAVAVAWVLAWREVTGAIVGARDARQVQDWTPAAELQLSSADIELITHSIARSGAGVGPLAPSA